MSYHRTSTSSTSTTSTTTTSTSTSTTPPPPYYIDDPLSERTRIINEEIEALVGQVNAWTVEHGPHQTLESFSEMLRNLGAHTRLVAREYGSYLCNECRFGMRNSTNAGFEYWTCAATSNSNLCTFTRITTTVGGNIYGGMYTTTPRGTFMPEETYDAIVAEYHPNYRYLRKGICKDCENRCPSRKKLKACPFQAEKTINIDLTNPDNLTLLGCRVQISEAFSNPNTIRLVVHNRIGDYQLSGGGDVLAQLSERIMEYETDFGEAPGVLTVSPRVHAAMVDQIFGVTIRNLA